MEELLKKINGKLVEIKSKLDKDTFHISGGSKNISQVNNYTINMRIPKNTIVCFKRYLFFPFISYKSKGLSYLKLLILWSIRILNIGFGLGFVFFIFSQNKHNINQVEYGIFVLSFYFACMALWHYVYFNKKIEGQKEAQ